MSILKKALPVFLIAAFAMAVPLAHGYAEDEGAKSPKKEAGEGTDSKKPAKGATDVTGGRFAGDPIYVHIDPLMLPVITDKGVEQIITILLDIEVKDFDVADNIHAQMPRVRDALMRALYGGLGQGSLRTGKIADVAKIKAKANMAISEIIGNGNVQDVLIQGIAQRML